MATATSYPCLLPYLWPPLGRPSVPSFFPLPVPPCWLIGCAIPCLLPFNFASLVPGRRGIPRCVIRRKGRNGDGRSGGRCASSESRSQHENVDCGVRTTVRTGASDAGKKTGIYPCAGTPVTGAGLTIVVIVARTPQWAVGRG